MNILKPSIIMMICWFSVVGGAHAATYQKTLVIPAINNAPVSWSRPLAPDEDAELTFEPGASPPGYCYQGMKIALIQEEGFCWVGSFYIINAEHKSATATVIATCTWVPCGEGGGGGGPPPQNIVNTGIGTAEAQPGTYWITAGNNVLAIGDPDPVTVNAYKNKSIDAPSTWTHSPKLDLVPKSTSADVTGIASSSMPGDAWVRGDSIDYKDLFDEEYFTVVELLSIEAEPDVVCVDGEVSYTITTQPEGYNYMVSYTPADTSTPGIKQVIATCGSSASTCTVTVVGAEITAGFDRVAPAKTKQVDVTTIPSPLPAGYSITLVCEPDPGTVGSAPVSPDTINESTTVTITGGEQSWGSGANPAPKNIKLKAKLGNCVCGQGEGFTVCAHVTSITSEYSHEIPEWLGGYGFMVKLVIASDSGNSNDLNQAYVREKVNRYASLIPDPPFIPDPDWSDNDVFIPVDGYSCVSPPDDSHHWSNSKLRMNNLTPGSFTVDQTWQWECRRCSAGNWHNNTHYIITRTVAGTNGNWTITIDQSGVHSGAYNIVP